MNELFFIALYLLSFSSPIISPSLLQSGGEATSFQPGSPAAPSMIWTTPWSAGAMEMARQVQFPTPPPSNTTANCSTAERTRWTAAFRGRWPQSPSSSCFSNNTSTWCNLLLPASGWRRATEPRGRDWDYRGGGNNAAAKRENTLHHAGHQCI